MYLQTVFNKRTNTVKSELELSLVGVRQFLFNNPKVGLIGFCIVGNVFNLIHFINADKVFAGILTVTMIHCLNA